MKDPSPPKEKHAPARSVLIQVDFSDASYRYHEPAEIQQPLKSRRVPLSSRRCLACGVRVDNFNLGGYDGRSALSGLLWCYRHADGLSIAKGGR